MLCDVTTIQFKPLFRVYIRPISREIPNESNHRHKGYIHTGLLKQNAFYSAQPSTNKRTPHKEFFCLFTKLKTANGVYNLAFA